MQKNKQSEFKRLVKAFGYSMDGLKTTLGEAAFRLELAVSIIAIPLALFLGKGGVEKALLAGSILLVLMAELVNTAIECVVNRISTEIHPLSKNAKDIGSAVVLLAIINAFLIWLVILWN